MVLDRFEMGGLVMKRMIARTRLETLGAEMQVWKPKGQRLLPSQGPSIVWWKALRRWL